MTSCTINDIDIEAFQNDVLGTTASELSFATSMGKHWRICLCLVQTHQRSPAIHQKKLFTSSPANVPYTDILS